MVGVPLNCMNALRVKHTTRKKKFLTFYVFSDCERKELLKCHRLHQKSHTSLLYSRRKTVCDRRIQSISEYDARIRWTLYYHVRPLENGGEATQLMLVGHMMITTWQM